MPLVTGPCTANTDTHHHPPQGAHFSQYGIKETGQHSSQTTHKPHAPAKAPRN